MPKSRATKPGAHRKSGWGLLSACVGVFTFALAVSGCASTALSPAGDGAPIAALTTAATDTSQPTTPAPAATTTSAKPKVVTPTTHIAKPKPKPIIATTKAALSLCGAPANPFGYNFCGRGGYIYGADPAKCLSVNSRCSNWYEGA
jgi:hypothetical protein